MGRTTTAHIPSSLVTSLLAGRAGDIRSVAPREEMTLPAGAILYCWGALPSLSSALAMISRVRSIMSGLTDTEVMPHSTSFSVRSG